MADLAGILDQLALAATAGAGLLGLHHAKGGALLTDHEAAAAAVRAGLGAGTGGTAAAVALGALLLAGDGDVLLAAVHGLVKAQGDAHADILTLARCVGVRLTGRAAKAAEAAAKDIAENVAQIHAVAAKTAKAARTGAAAVLCCIGRVNTCKAVLVVQLALLRVRKHLVCFVYFLELFLGVLIAGVIVRVVFHCKLAVCLFDLGIGRSLGYPQHFVVITLFLCHIHSPLRERLIRETPRLVPRSITSKSRSGKTGAAFAIPRVRPPVWPGTHCCVFYQTSLKSASTTPSSPGFCWLFAPASGPGCAPAACCAAAAA